MPMAIPKLAARRRPRSAAPAVVLGKIVGWSEAGPLVAHPGSPDCQPARTTVPLDRGAVGREAALVFVAGQPLIIGLLQPTGPASKPLRAVLDGQRLFLDAAEEIVLRCGQASITLTKAGKVLIRGAYLLSRSSGVNRIKGGSVQIN